MGISRSPDEQTTKITNTPGEIQDCDGGLARRPWKHSRPLQCLWNHSDRLLQIILMEDGSRLFERGGVDKERQRLEDENHKLREAVGSITMELKKTIGDGCTQTPCPQGKPRQRPAA